MTFEVTELLHVKVAVEVKSCFSFSYDRNLLSASKRKQLVHSCTIDVAPSQTVFGGRVTAAFTNTQTSGAQGWKVEDDLVTVGAHALDRAVHLDIIPS